MTPSPSPHVLNASYLYIASPQEASLPCSTPPSKNAIVSIVKLFLGIISVLLALASYLTLSGQYILILPQHCAVVAIGLAIALILFGITYLSCLLKESAPQAKWMVVTLAPPSQFPDDQQEVQSTHKTTCSESLSDEPPSYQSIMETETKS
ncbi:hypothetical protein [Chlamydia pecorum]|uniref:hypothetical protein n=1 Tax=Chlamydia pecorum TaxID=85991 RepID=UPI0007AF62F6|nr:hypothetical protein [Chlamydia pecorum]KZN26662.1 hypothetical protein cpL17_0801 [Chlamydia pecorum]KZN26933.1 hypothetical protein cpL71_0790 [Chlamydia pecorum]